MVARPINYSEPIPSPPSPQTPKQAESDSFLVRIAKIALPIFASLAGFVFLPFEAAIAMSAVVTTIGALFFGGCLDCKSMKKIFKFAPSLNQMPQARPVGYEFVVDCY
jgi:hypothetical protein